MDEKIIANIKSLALDMINNSGSGHSGIVLSGAPIIYTLFSRHLNISLNDPTWVNRDRFVLSAGHGSALLYACLYMAGYNIKLDDLKNFRKISSKAPGHPELGTTPGVEMTTGMLGQGFASAVGMALGGKILSSKYVIPKKNSISVDSHLIDYKVYVYVSDGDLMEGITNEAASLAGNLKLNNLIVLYDSNNVSLDGNTNKTFTENVLGRFKALGWNTIKVKKGKSVNSISKAINKAKSSLKPTIIEIKTIIGDGLEQAGTNLVHGKVLSNSELEGIKQKLGVPNESFFVSDELKRTFMGMISSHSSSKYSKWANNYEVYVKNYLGGDFSKLNYLFDRNNSYNIINYNWQFENDLKEATRVTNGRIMQELAKYIPNFIGGSADVNSSVKTYLENFGDISCKNYNGRNIWFGVREHAMGAILNGLVLSKFKAFGSTFLTFADYMKPAIRLSALAKIPAIYIFSHDSVNIGPDGPTHQPVEQLTMLRSISNLNVYRPADAHELVGCWNEILNSKTKPSALILSRQDVTLLPTTRADLVNRGAYIVFQPNDNYSVILVATGSEVQTAFYIASDLWKEKGISVRVVSMPSMELYFDMPLGYKQNLMPKHIKTFAIEAGSSYSFGKIIHDDNCLITIDKFGASGSSNDVLKYCHFDYESIKKHILDNI